MIREKLIAFFRAEIDAEEHWGFPRLNRIPESFLQDRLNHYRGLKDAEKEHYKDCSATFAAACHTYVVDTSDIEHTTHPYYSSWREFKKTLMDDPNFQNVPIFRAMIQQYKIDRSKGVQSSISDAQFALACSIRPVKLQERKRRVRAALRKLGLVSVDDRGLYRCHYAGEDLPFTSILVVGTLNSGTRSHFPSSRAVIH